MLGSNSTKNIPSSVLLVFVSFWVFFNLAEALFFIHPLFLFQKKKFWQLKLHFWSHIAAVL